MLKPEVRRAGYARDLGSLPYVVLAFVVLLWSFGPPLSKHLTVEPQLAAWLRMGMAAVLMLTVSTLVNGRPRWERLRLSAVSGVLFGAGYLLILVALRHLSVAATSVITAMQPVVVLVVAGPLFGERIRPWHVWWTGVGIVGAVAVVLGTDTTIRVEPMGVLAAVASLLTGTGFFLISKHVARSIDPIEYIAGVNLFATLVLTPVALLTSSVRAIADVAAADWVTLVLLVTLPGAAHIMMSWCHQHVPASISGMALLLQTAGSALIAWPLEHEPVTLLQVLGGVIVLFSVGQLVRRPVALRVPERTGAAVA